MSALLGFEAKGKKAALKIACQRASFSRGGPDEATDRCFECAAPLNKPLVCSRCKVSRYCSKRCQKAAWKDDYTGAGHKLGCDTYLENLRPGGVPADQGKCAAICMAGSCWLDPEEELDDALAQREAYFFADPDVPQVLHLIISCTNALGAVRMGITATLGRAGTIYHAMDLVYAAIDEGPRAEAMLDSWTLARGGGLSSAARTRALDTILQFAQRAAAAGRGGCFCGVCLGRGMTWLLDEPTFLPRARSAGLSQLMSPHVGQDHIMDAMSPAAIMASMMAEQESPGGHLAAAAPSAAMAETAHGAADELLVAVGNIREANPNMGIKKVVAAVKAANPAWSVGAKEVREALKTLADNPSALRAVAAATADDQQQTEIERLMRLQLGPAGGMSAGASAAGPSPLHGRGLPTTAEAAAAARHERAQELDTKAAAGAAAAEQLGPEPGPAAAPAPLHRNKCECGCTEQLPPFTDRESQTPALHRRLMAAAGVTDPDAAEAGVCKGQFCCPGCDAEQSVTPEEEEKGDGWIGRCTNCNMLIIGEHWRVEGSTASQAARATDEADYVDYVASATRTCMCVGPCSENRFCSNR